MPVEKRKMLSIRKGNPIENIIASYLDERKIVLSEQEQELKIRYSAAFTMLIKNSVLHTAKKLSKLYDVDLTTAYRYINNAETIFGSTRKFNKNAWRWIQIEKKQKIIKKLYEKKKPDYALIARIEADIDKIIGFDKEENQFNLDKIAAMNITINVPKSTIASIKTMTTKGVVDLNNYEAEAEDIDHEDVTNED